MVYSTIEIGKQHSTDYRIYIRDKYGPISPLHDIPLYVDSSKTVCNMVVEAPRFTNAKMEITLEEPLNPIKQAAQGGIPRFIPNCFPYHGFLWNYGALPQTYESPGQAPDITRCRGGDPIDVVEIGQRGAQTGEVLNVKILGALALVDLDDLQYDWQLIVIDTRDPLAAHLKDVSEIEKYLPGLLKATMDWFQIYKVPFGKPANLLGPGGGLKSANFAHNIIDEVHGSWKLLMSRMIRNVALTNTTLGGTVYRISRNEAEKVVHMRNRDVCAVEGTDESLVNKVYFIERCCSMSYCNCKL